MKTDVESFRIESSKIKNLIDAIESCNLTEIVVALNKMPTTNLIHFAAHVNSIMAARLHGGHLTVEDNKKEGE